MTRKPPQSIERLVVPAKRPVQKGALGATVREQFNHLENRESLLRLPPRLWRKRQDPSKVTSKKPRGLKYLHFI